MYWSKDFENRLNTLQRSPNKSPDSVGDTAEDQAINGKVAELFRHMESFLTLRHGSDVYIVPGLDPRALTRQTDPDDRLHAWVSLGAIMDAEKWRTSDDLTIAAIMADDPQTGPRAAEPRSRDAPSRGPSESSRQARRRAAAARAGSEGEGRAADRNPAVKQAGKDTRRVRRGGRVGLRLVDARLRRTGAPPGPCDGNGPQADDAAQREVDRFRRRTERPGQRDHLEPL